MMFLIESVKHNNVFIYDEVRRFSLFQEHKYKYIYIV